MRRYLTAAATVAGLAFVGLNLAGCASTPTPATPSPPTWKYSFESGPGIAAATLISASGKVVTAITCQAPNGDVIIHEYALPPASGPSTPTFSIDKATIAPAAHNDIGPPPALTLTIPSRDPVWLNLRPTSRVATGRDNQYHWLEAGAAEKIGDVLRTCRQTGS
jgi:hypothetical protein